MHGIIFTQLRKFVDAAAGRDAWQTIATDAGLARVTHLATQSYPDEQLLALVTAAVRRTGIAAPQLLDRFGEFIVPDLLQVYGAFVKREWTALDLLENTESVMHKAVRVQTANATPPQLKITRTAPTRVTIEYSSPRRLCAVAKGLVRGIGKHYGEPLVIDETACMHAGAPACTIVASKTTA